MLDCCNDGSGGKYLEELTGLAELQRAAEAFMLEEEFGDDEDDW